MPVNYDGPDESVECAYPGCSNRLRRSDFNEPQFCSKEHRDAAAAPLAATGRREPRTGNAAGLRCTSKPARVWVLPNRSNVTLGWRKALGV